MKLTNIALSIVALLLLGGFAYLSIAEIPVVTQDVTKTIPHERFLTEQSQ